MAAFRSVRPIGVARPALWCAVAAPVEVGVRASLAQRDPRAGLSRERRAVTASALSGSSDKDPAMDVGGRGKPIQKPDHRHD
jgi:hypothetical protein